MVATRKPTLISTGNTMKWYFKIRGGHVHVRVFMNGGRCGNLCFRDYEFTEVQRNHSVIQFINEDTTCNEQACEMQKEAK